MFERLIAGTENVYAAWLRDDLRLTGDMELFLAFWKFPPMVTVTYPSGIIRDRWCVPGGDTMTGNTYRILEGNTFLVCDERGDTDPSPTFPTRLFSLDTRFLSCWHLSVNGERLHALSVDERHYFRNRFFSYPARPPSTLTPTCRWYGTVRSCSACANDSSCSITTSSQSASPSE